MAMKPHTSSFAYLLCSCLPLFLSGCVVLLPFIEQDNQQHNLSESGGELISKYSLCDTEPRRSVRSRRVRYVSKQKQTLGRLLANLENGNDVERTHAATDIGRLSVRSEILVAALSRSAKHDSSKWVRRASVKSLARIGGDGVVPPLRQALSDSDEWVVHSARRALQGRN